jgi:signal transduction histidine kinase
MSPNGLGGEHDGAPLRESTDQIRRLTRRLIEGQEAERARLAREFHDDFLQRLALLGINLDLLQQSLPTGAESARAAVRDLYGQVQALARDVRRTSHGLHPARLELLGLVPALQGLCSDLSAAHDLAIAVDASGVPEDLPDAVALCLYRVTQEALHNVTKHSGATSARVELLGRSGEIRLVVKDDGRGFQVEQRPRKDCLGLAGMRERVHLVHGRLAVRSAPGQGTRVEASVPLAAKKTA